MNNGGGLALPDIAYLQYQMASAESVTSPLFGGVGQTLIPSLVTDRGSFPNGLLQKFSATAFRALVNCQVRVSYDVVIHSNTDNDGIDVDILNNGVAVPQAHSGLSGRNSTVEPNHAQKTFIVDMVANQDLQLQLTKLEGNSTITVRTETTMAVEFIRRT